VAGTFAWADSAVGHKRGKVGWGRGGDDPCHGAAMLRHRDRLALLHSVDDRAGFVLEFAVPTVAFAMVATFLAKNGHNGEGTI
jgi:hypothetical protein